jgi:hypothetical protein
MGGNQKHERVDGDKDNDIYPDDNDNDDASTKSLLVEVRTKLMKSLGTHGEYTGIILKLPMSNQAFYSVQYEDSDEEDMEEDELRSVLERDQRRRKRNRDAFDKPKVENVVKKLHGLSQVAKPAPVVKSGHGRPPKRKANEVQALATRRGLGSVAKQSKTKYWRNRSRSPAHAKLKIVQIPKIVQENPTVSGV